MVPRALLVSALAFGFAACTHDFDAFEPGAGTTEAEGGVDGGGPPSDASVDRSPGSDGSPGTDSGPKDAGPDAPVCVQQTLDACINAQTGCIQTCDQTYATCFGKCGPPGCKQKCANDQTTCHNACDTTCQSCAGPACTGRCPNK